MDAINGSSFERAQLFDLPGEIELTLEQVLDENWYPDEVEAGSALKGRSTFDSN